MPPDSPLPWPLRESRPGPDLRLFRVRHDVRINPRNGHALTVLVLESHDWVNVVAITPRQEILFVRQFRFGTEQVTLEIPGGLIAPGEAPAAAALRELREETGHVAAQLVPLGPVEPNPAFLTNLCHQFLATGVTPAGSLALDDGEDIAVVALPFDEVRQLVDRGVIRHSLVLTALARVLDLRRQ